METKYIQEHNKLIETRKPISNEVLNSKKELIWNYFNKFELNINNIKKNINNNIPLYSAPLNQIHGSNLTCWPIQERSEIYIDNTFLVSPGNIKIINHQLTHELLHTLVKTVNPIKFFGHIYSHEERVLLNGINEATTQIFTDDIEGKVLPANEDYLYFIKCIIRIFACIIGKEKLANQYLNNDITFEKYFNLLTNNSFDSFNKLLNNVYILSKKRYYKRITNEEIHVLKSYQNQLISFTNSIINKDLSSNPSLKEKILKEMNNCNFLLILGNNNLK